MPAGEPEGMVLALCVIALLCTLTIYTVARIAMAVIARLGIDPMDILLWFGLAERPHEQPRVKDGRLGELLADSPFVT